MRLGESHLSRAPERAHPQVGARHEIGLGDLPGGQIAGEHLLQPLAADIGLGDQDRRGNGNSGGAAPQASPPYSTTITQRAEFRLIVLFRHSFLTARESGR